MCILALYFQQFRDFPIVVAANRDESYSRPSAGPRALGHDPGVFGGKDLRAGGTWLGVSEHGLFAGILNRRSGSPGRRVTEKSRGLLCLDILGCSGPAEARELLRRETPSAYRPFNLVFGNSAEAYIAYNIEGEIQCVRLDQGVHVVGNTIYDTPSGKMDHAQELFDSVREQVERGIRRPFVAENLDFFLPLFRGILSDHRTRTGSGNPRDGICVHTPNYGTVSSTLIFGHSHGPRYYHAPGPPCIADYEACPLEKVPLERSEGDSQPQRLT